MIIGVLSDTHLKGPTSELEELNRTVFSGADLILHAGDLVEVNVLQAFRDKEVVAVHGNMDSIEAKKALPERRVIELQGYRIGLTHGWGAPAGMESRIKTLFDHVDVIVFGHTHHTCSHVENGVLFFNPGAFAGRFYGMGKRTVGLITLGDSVKGEHIIV